jgi:hypothetical protein
MSKTHNSGDTHYSAMLPAVLIVVGCNSVTKTVDSSNEALKQKQIAERTASVKEEINHLCKTHNEAVSSALAWMTSLTHPFAKGIRQRLEACGVCIKQGEDRIMGYWLADGTVRGEDKDHVQDCVSKAKNCEDVSINAKYRCDCLTYTAARDELCFKMWRSGLTVDRAPCSLLCSTPADY